MGYYGDFGGAYIPEMLHRNVEELKSCYKEIINDAAFQSEFQNKIDDINIKISDVSSTINDLQSKETEIIETPQIF
jgi:tryptophan synthase beta subunit